LQIASRFGLIDQVDQFIKTDDFLDKNGLIVGDVRRATILEALECSKDFAESVA